MINKTSLGRAMVFGSAISFYLSTVSVRWAEEASANLEVEHFITARFFLGFVLAFLFILNPFGRFFNKAAEATKKLSERRLNPKRLDLLAARSLSNMLAVFALYRCVETRSVAEANILNMCYPVYVAMASVFIFKSGNYRMLWLSLLAFAGVVLVVVSGNDSFEMDGLVSAGTLWGLVSGLAGGFSVICLRYARECNSSNDVIAVVFSIAFLTCLLLFWNKLYIPNSSQFYFLTISAFSGVIGQYLITYGFAFITASEGSVIGLSRIVFAAVFGSIITGDDPLSLLGFFGASIILVVNLLIFFGKNSQKGKV